MSQRTIPRIPVIADVLLLLAVIATVAWEPRSGGEGFWYYLTIGGALSIVWVSVGSLVVSREPKNPIGWIQLTVGFAFAVWGLCSVLGSSLVLHDVAAGVWIAWLGGTAVGCLALLPFLFLLFPTGHVPAPRWRIVSWILGVAGALVVVTAVLTPDPDLNVLADVGIVEPNPVAIGALEGRGNAIGTTAATVLLVASLLAVVSLWQRYRRARGDERQQIRWLAFVGAAAAVLVLGNLVLWILDIIVELPENSLFWLALSIPFIVTISVGIPVATGIAILKYHLYDLDVVIKKTVQAAILVSAFAVLALVLVLAVPTFMGLTGPNLAPTAMFAVVLAAAFVWIRGPAKRFADRLVYGERATPYEVLTEFSERVGETYASDDVLPRMAAVLGEGAGAEHATVWLRVGAAMRPEAVWPAGGEPPTSLPDDAVDVVQQGETLGALSVTMPADDPMNPAKAKLVRDLAAQAGPVLRNVRLIQELRASRQRLVAAQDQERRKLERNIHDGAQQQLVALAVQLKLAEGLVDRDPARTRELLASLQTSTGETLEDLRDLARGIYPPLLADQGLVPALEAQARKGAVPTTVWAEGLGRYGQEVESAVYFCCLEALNNVAKYADASRASVHLLASNGSLTFRVTDDGRGFETSSIPRGTGIQGMRDRVDAIGGALTVESAPGRGTEVAGSVPVGGERT